MLAFLASGLTAERFESAAVSVRCIQWVRLAWRLVLWGESPLYENEGLKEGSIPTVTPIDKVLGEGNCGSGDRPWGGSPRMRSLSRYQIRRRPHSRQSCEATYRNSIQGRYGPVSGPSITKPSSFIRSGKSRACAAKAGRPIQGDLPTVPVSRACPKGGATVGDCGRARQKSAEGIVRIRHTPLAAGRPKPRRTRRSYR